MNCTMREMYISVLSGSLVSFRFLLVAEERFTVVVLNENYRDWQSLVLSLLLTMLFTNSPS